MPQNVALFGSMLSYTSAEPIRRHGEALIKFQDLLYFLMLFYGPMLIGVNGCSISEVCKPTVLLLIAGYW